MSAGREKYLSLSSAKPEVRHIRQIEAIDRNARVQQHVDSQNVQIDGLRQRAVSALSDLMELGLPGSTMIEVVELLPVKGLAGFIERRRTKEADEKIRVKWLTTGKRSSFLDWEDRLLVVQRTVGGYLLKSEPHGGDKYRNWYTYILATDEVGVALDMQYLSYPDRRLGFDYRGCVGVLEEKLVPLSKTTQLDEESVARLEAHVAEHI